MPVDVQTSTGIARLRAEVVAVATEPDNATRWYTTIRSVAWEDTGGRWHPHGAAQPR